MKPDQLFVVSTISREGIAELISHWIDIDPTDERLTDEFCQRFADQLNRIEPENDDAESEIACTFANELTAR